VRAGAVRSSRWAHDARPHDIYARRYGLSSAAIAEDHNQKIDLPWQPAAMELSNRFTALVLRRANPDVA
jgi:hypothetical protein